MGHWTEWLDRWFERRFHIRPIGEGGHVMRLGLIRHRGPRLEFEDGTVVGPGDVVGELHLDNARTAALHEQGSPGLRFRREVLRMLHALARDLVARPEYRSVPAVCGASLFWEEATFVGFEVRQLPSFTRSWLGWWERYLLARYHPAGRRRLAEGDRTELRQVWMTRRTLLARYGGKAVEEGAPAEGGAPEPAGRPPA